MSLYEAWQGAKTELASLPSPITKVQRFAGIARTFAAELVGQVQLAPYGYRALRTHQTLARPQQQSGSQLRRDQVSLIRDIQYGPKSRQQMDIYLPAQGTSSASDRMPIACFVHGGVWAVGDRWQYAPLGKTCAEGGVVAVVLSYTLFPQALVPEMVSEVSEALSFTIDNAASWGGDPKRISLIGHSAGAQLAAMALLNRTKRHKEADEKLTSECRPDQRMPKRLIGMAGVYDLTKHFDYENERRVGELSTMKRAAGGVAGFPSCSPAVILAQAVTTSLINDGNLPLTDVFAKAPGLVGEALATRIGFERPRGAMVRQLAATVHDPVLPPLQLSVAEARKLPPVILMSGSKDLTVPWYQSAEMFWMLHDAGCPVKHLCYPFADHADFVTKFDYDSANIKASDTSGVSKKMPPQCRDLLTILREDVEVDYC